MVYLDDVGPGDGAFSVIPGSADAVRKNFRNIFDEQKTNVLEMSNPAYGNMKNDDVPEGLGDLVGIYGPAGTLVVFDTDTYHCGGQLDEGHERRILRGHSGPAKVYKSVRRGGRQWWRGEKVAPLMTRLREKIAA